jgi:hypothetical protein
MRQAITLGCALLAAATTLGSASAATVVDATGAIPVSPVAPLPPPPLLVPVLYTVYGAVDGELNGVAFSNAQFRLDFRSVTADVKTVVENGLTVYRNDTGQAVLFLTRGNTTTVANISANQIYVRYEPTTGVVGFGSYAIGPYYPVALNTCGGPPCAKPPTTESFEGEGSILGALAQLREAAQDSMYYSAAVPKLATTLRGPALLGGFLDACVAIRWNPLPPSCPNKPSVAIKTDQGNLYFQKQSPFGHGIFTAVTGAGTPW